MRHWRTLWRRYRSLPRRAQAMIATGAVVAAVVISAISGGAKPPKSSVGISSSTSAAATTSTTTASTSSTSSTTSTSVAPTSTAVTAVPVTHGAPPPAAPGTCHARGSGEMVLPDPVCTPGATNPAVTQATIHQTICVSGWSSTVRPPESYTEPLKIAQMAAYGDTGPTSAYEEDHLISLELGGSPTDHRNLWPEPGASPNPKDKVENAAHTAVCDGRLTLAAARTGIASDWIALGQQLGVTSTSPAPAASTVAPSTAATAPAASGCSPKTSSGGCYRAGETCPAGDERVTGTDANGEAITCRDVNGWRWEH